MREKLRNEGIKKMMEKRVEVGIGMSAENGTPLQLHSLEDMVGKYNCLK